MKRFPFSFRLPKEIFVATQKLATAIYSLIMEDCNVASYEDDSVTCGQNSIETESLYTDRVLYLDVWKKSTAQSLMGIKLADRKWHRKNPLCGLTMEKTISFFSDQSTRIKIVTLSWYQTKL